MEDQYVTAAAIISFAEQLEDCSATFYEELAGRFAQHKDKFLAFAKDSKKNKVFIVRTYQETITDAMEACFSFEGLNLNDYALEDLSAKGRSDAEGLAMALALEEKAITFYADVAGRCQSLLGTIPWAFRRVAEARSKRKAQVEVLQ